MEDHDGVSTRPSLLQAEEAQVSQPIFTREVLQPSGHLYGLPVELFQQLYSFIVLGVLLSPQELSAENHGNKYFDKEVGFSFFHKNTT